MIVINAGMPKSATTLVMEYQKDMIQYRSPKNALEEMRSHTPGGGVYVDEIDETFAETMRAIHCQHGEFLVKTHSGPANAIKGLVADGEARASFCFRDPRDTILSAIDHGERTRKGLDGTGAFKDVTDVAGAIGFTRKHISLYFAWKDYGEALLIQYEDFMADKVGHLKRTADYFAYEIGKQALLEIFEKHEGKKETAWNFNTGRCFRWKTEMSGQDVMLCEEAFGEEIVAMGYESGITKKNS